METPQHALFSSTTLAKVEEQRIHAEDKARAEQLWKNYKDERIDLKFILVYILSGVITFAILWFMPNLTLWLSSLYGNSFEVMNFNYLPMLVFRGMALFEVFVMTAGAPAITYLLLRPAFAEKYPEIERVLNLNVK